MKLVLVYVYIGQQTETQTVAVFSGLLHAFANRNHTISPHVAHCVIYSRLMLKMCFISTKVCGHTCFINDVVANTVLD